MVIGTKQISPPIYYYNREKNTMTVNGGRDLLYYLKYSICINRLYSLIGNSLDINNKRYGNCFPISVYPIFLLS